MRRTIFILLLLALCSCGKEGYSEGDRYGVVNKFSHKGFFCKSWEGELTMEGFQQTDHGVTANVWQFSVRPNDEHGIVEKLQQAAASGKRVKIHYHQAYLAPACETETDYFVKDVEVER